MVVATAVWVAQATILNNSSILKSANTQEAAAARCAQGRGPAADAKYNSNHLCRTGGVDVRNSQSSHQTLQPKACDLRVIVPLSPKAALQPKPATHTSLYIMRSFHQRSEDTPLSHLSAREGQRATIVGVAA